MINLNWLTRHWKDIITPKIICLPNLTFVGQYFWPNNLPEVTDYDFEMPPIPNGAIVLRNIDDDSTIAHEYRHHLQYVKKGKWWDTDLNLIGRREYFYHDSELDATLFELVMVNDISTVKWLEDYQIGKRLSRDVAINYIPNVRGAFWILD